MAYTDRMVVMHGATKRYENCIRENAYADQLPTPIQLESEIGEIGRILHRNGYNVHCARFSTEILPDAVFARDPAVVLRNHGEGCVLLMEMAREHRQPEVDYWASFYRACLPEEWKVVRLSNLGPANMGFSIEGGDIVEAIDRDSGPVFFVGQSKRTNAASIALLMSLANRFDIDVQPVEISSKCSPHLGTGCTVFGNVVLINGDWVDATPFIERGIRPVYVPADEPDAANVLPFVGLDRRIKVILANCFPKTRRLVEEAGYEALPINLQGLRYGQGGPSCVVRPFSYC